MSARKILHEEVNRVNKLLNKRKEVQRNIEEDLAQPANDILVENNSEAKILPYKRKLLVKQYYKLRMTLADYIDNAQVNLFDQAIRIMDKVHISRDDN